MPRKVVTFYCEVCGERFGNEKDAEACEKKHKIVSSVSKAEYDKADKKNEFPLSVLVNFADGTSARYYRKS